jgi:hypothetical protein
MTPRSSPASLGLAAAAVLPTSIAIGALYAWGARLIPIAALSVFLTIGTACLIGWVVGKAAIRHIIMSRSLVATIAAISASAALYISWAVDAFLRIPGVGLAAFTPPFLMEYISASFEFSKISVSGDGGDVVIEGWGLAILWLGEAAILVIGAAAMALSTLANAPAMCPACRTYKTEQFGVLRCAVPDDVQSFANDVCAGRDGCLDKIDVASIDDDPHLRIDVSFCPSCHGDCDVSVAVRRYSAEPHEVYVCQRRPLSVQTLGRILEIAKAHERDEDELAESGDDRSP